VNRTLIGCPPTAERQKIGFDPIATERRLRRNGRWQQQRRNGIFSRKQRNSCSAYIILTEFMQWERRNGNGRTATEWWKTGITEIHAHASGFQLGD